MVASIVAIGCTNVDTPVEIPTYDASKITEEAFALADADKDKTIDSEEIQPFPGLAAGGSRVDPNGDGSVSQEELISRIKFYNDDQIALVDCNVRIILDGHPLEGATVTFVPEPFMGPTIQEASAVTDQDGFCYPGVDGVELTGIQSGMYRVEVSKVDDRGQEVVPEQYNTKTTLGQEVATDVPDLERGLTLTLSSSSS